MAGPERGGGEGRPAIRRVLVHDSQPAEVLEVLRERAPDIEVAFCESYEALPDALAAHRPQAVACTRFAGGAYPREVLLDQPGLAWVHVMGAGIDHLLPWDARRIVLTNAAGIQAEAMAQYALAGIFAINFRFPKFWADKTERTWEPAGVTSAEGQTLTVLGLGRIGQALAAHARGFGMRVIGVRRSGEPSEHADRVVRPSELDAVLPETDHLVALLPRTEETLGLLDARRLALLPPTATVANLGRGGIIDEAALARALDEGRLRGALLDVFETEPLPANSPLWALPNAILTPHVAAVFKGWKARSAELFCDNLARWQRGASLVNVVDPARGY